MKRRLKIVVVLIIVLGLATLIGSGLAIRDAARGRTFSNASAIPYRPVGVILGCSQRLPDGRTNLFFDYRIAAAARIFKARKVDYFIVSGDNHVKGYDEPADMKRALVHAGVPAEHVYCDYAGFRTLDSIVRAKAVFGQTSITIVSQEFHNQRAIYIARHAGIDAIGFNARAVDSYNSFRTRFRELFARVRTVLDVCLLGTRPKFLGPKVEIGPMVTVSSLKGVVTANRDGSKNDPRRD
jgi:SanA protein